MVHVLNICNRFILSDSIGFSRLWLTMNEPKHSTRHTRAPCLVLNSMRVTSCSPNSVHRSIIRHHVTTCRITFLSAGPTSTIRHTLQIDDHLFLFLAVLPIPTRRKPFFEMHLISVYRTRVLYSREKSFYLNG